MLGAEVEDFKNDDFSLAAVEIPQGSIIQREIRKALNGEKFFYNDENGKPVDCEECSEEVFSQYLSFFQKLKYIGMPHGQGWLNEPEWVSVFFVFMTITEKNVMTWAENKEYKKTKRHNKWPAIQN